MAEIIIYSTPWCPFCNKAKALLDSLNANYTDIDVSKNPDLRREMIAKANGTSVPQIFIGGTHIGGCDDLHELHAQGKLENLLK